MRSISCLQSRGEVKDDVQVAFDELPNAGALDLDNDLLAVAKSGAVHLTDRRGGEGPILEVREELGGRAPEFGREQGLDLGRRSGFDAVLEALEMSDYGRREELAPG